MTGARIYWQVDLAAIRAQLAHAAAMGEDLSPLMEEIAGIFASATEDAFEGETDPAGLAWRELSEARIEQRTAKGSWPGKKLQDDGILVSSVQTQSGPTFAEIGSPMEYAAAHQFGVPSRNLPERPFLGLGPEHETDIMQAVVNYFDSFPGAS